MSLGKRRGRGKQLYRRVAALSGPRATRGGATRARGGAIALAAGRWVGLEIGLAIPGTGNEAVEVCKLEGFLRTREIGVKVDASNPYVHRLGIFQTRPGHERDQPGCDRVDDLANIAAKGTNITSVQLNANLGVFIALNLGISWVRNAKEKSLVTKD